MDKLKTELFEKAKKRAENLYNLYTSWEETNKPKVEFNNLSDKQKELWINVALGKPKPEPDAELKQAEKDKLKAEKKIKKLEKQNKDIKIKDLSKTFKI